MSPQRASQRALSGSSASLSASPQRAFHQASQQGLSGFSASLPTRPQRILSEPFSKTSADPQRILSEPFSKTPASRTETNRDDPGGAEGEAGEQARTKAGRGTRATGRTGRDLTRQTRRSQGRGESQPSSECDPDTAGRTRGRSRQTQGGVTL